MNIPALHSVSFGMNVSSAGRYLAKKTLNAPKNDFNNEEYFKKIPAFAVPPFTRDAARLFNNPQISKAAAIAETRNIIIEHGTTKNAENNASFIRQLTNPATQDLLECLDKSERKAILSAEKEVFMKNWDNPSLKKNETLAFLNTIKGSMTPKTHTTWAGVIQSGDIELS